VARKWRWREARGNGLVGSQARTWGCEWSEGSCSSPRSCRSNGWGTLGGFGAREAQKRKLLVAVCVRCMTDHLAAEDVGRLFLGSAAYRSMGPLRLVVWVHWCGLPRPLIGISPGNCAAIYRGLGLGTHGFSSDATHASRLSGRVHVFQAETTVGQACFDESLGPSRILGKTCGHGEGLDSDAPATPLHAGEGLTGRPLRRQVRQLQLPWPAPGAPVRVEGD